MSTDKSRRRFIKQAAYVAPAILTLKALPAFARSGSQAKRPNGHRRRPHFPR